MPTSGRTRSWVPLAIGLATVLAIVGVTLARILSMNDGLVVYTLDDAYIHLALAENIWRGHYGINPAELAAPSSSVIWPLLLAPVAQIEVAPLVINALAALGTVVVYERVLRLAIRGQAGRMREALIAILLVTLILATNVTGLAFTGMEHSLQLLAVAAIALGLMVDAEEQRVPNWLVLAIAAAPLIRYECLALSALAIAYLGWRRHWKLAIAAALLTALPMAASALYLRHIGFGLLPTSLEAKSDLIGKSSRLASLFDGLHRSLTLHQGMVVAFGTLGLLAAWLVPTGETRENERRRMVLLVGAGAGLAHLLGGGYGQGNRYEIYIVALLYLMALYALDGTICRMMATPGATLGLAKIVALAAFCALITSMSYIEHVPTRALASNNIYEQQYQMHRFVTEFWQRPVAVNDLGYVAYKNDHYVLDLVGLASQDAHRYEKAKDSGDLLRDLVAERDCKLIMMYDGWFTQIPPEWHKLGELWLGKERIAPSRANVAFYTPDPAMTKEITGLIQAFSETLPEGARFEFVEPPAEQ